MLNVTFVIMITQLVFISLSAFLGEINGTMRSVLTY